MQFMTSEEAHRALTLIDLILDHAATGTAFAPGPEDAELIVLGLVVAVRVSEHAGLTIELGPGQG